MANKRVSDLTTATATEAISTSLLHLQIAAGNDRKITLSGIAAAFGIVSSTVAGLGSAATANLFKYATNGRKAGEGAGVGTGCLVRSNGSNWVRLDDGSTVAA